MAPFFLDKQFNIIFQWKNLFAIFQHSCTESEVTRGLEVINTVLLTGKSTESRSRHFSGFNNIFKLAGFKCNARGTYLRHYRWACLEKRPTREDKNTFTVNRPHYCNNIGVLNPQSIV